MQKILGIDPGINNTGWGIITLENNKIEYIASGVLKASSKSMAAKLGDIVMGLELVILTHTPSFAAIEDTFVNKNALSSLKLSHARGAAIATIAKSNIAIYQFAPNKVKNTITGHGHATKDQVSHMVSLLFRGVERKLLADEADALAVSYTCAMHLNSIVAEDFLI